MNFPAIIADKKFGRALTGEQIEAFVRGAADKTVPDYQLSALLYLRQDIICNIGIDYFYI